jgi:hypothetical protein
VLFHCLNENLISHGCVFCLEEAPGSDGVNLQERKPELPVLVPGCTLPRGLLPNETGYQSSGKPSGFSRLISVALERD